MVEAFRADQAVAGCSVALGSGDAVLFAGGFGEAAPTQKAGRQSVYRIGSVSKQFTAALALAVKDHNPQAAPGGFFDEPIAPWFPEAKFPGGITTGHLLRHASGLASYTDFTSFHKDQFRPVAAEDLLKAIAGRDLEFTPGTAGYYSNSNYFILALLMERMTGTPYKTLMETLILGRLGLGHTRFIDNRPRSAFEAMGADNNGFTRQRSDLSWVVGAGDLQSSVSDLALWNQKLLRGDVCSAGSRARMFESGFVNPQPAVPGERFAMGWMDISRNGRRIHYHQGFIHGFSAVNWLSLPEGGDSGRFVTVLCNKYLVQGLPVLAQDLSRIGFS